MGRHERRGRGRNGGETVPGKIAVIGTLDTKGSEIRYLIEAIRRQGAEPVVIDCGVMGDPAFPPDVTAADVAQAGGGDLAQLRERGDRGAAMAVMVEGVAEVMRRLWAQGEVGGAIGIGGSAGTLLGASAVAGLPFGVPKLIVSTLASGDVRPYVGTRDVTMMHSVVDILGVNRVLRDVLDNAAGAICGMVRAQAERPAAEDKPLIGITMFGVTTPCVMRAREILEEAGYETLVFHAVGTGGQAMEELVRDGRIAGVLDVTTTELADELVGGVLSAGPDRLTAAGEMGVPQVIAPGALDMVNFWAMDTVPEQFQSRNLYKHNENVTLMRTTQQENEKLGAIIGEKLKAAQGPTKVVLPMRGVSALDNEGQPFDDPEARRALYDCIKSCVGEDVEVVELDQHINDPEFAQRLASELMAMMGAQGNPA